MRWFACLLLTSAFVFGQQTSPAELARRAVEEHKRGDLAAAVRDYSELLKGRPELTKVRTNLATALTDLGRIDDAISVLEAAPPKERAGTDIRRGLALAYYSR